MGDFKTVAIYEMPMVRRTTKDPRFNFSAAHYLSLSQRYHHCSTNCSKIQKTDYLIPLKIQTDSYHSSKFSSSVVKEGLIPYDGL